MEIRDLPVFAEVYPGECVHSWLDATRLRLGMKHADWWAWCSCDPSEPERPSHKKAWTGLPAGLGRIDDVPVDWRIAPEWRGVCCPLCVTESTPGIRHPVLVDWLDVRTLCCEQHGLLLCPRGPSERINVTTDSELVAWCDWLRQWREDGKLEVHDRLLRRDLALAAARNWNPSWGPIASVEYGWVLKQRGWLGEWRTLQYRPGGPGRVGGLGHADRMSALYAAWQAWLALREGLAVALPKWPIEAWLWLEPRWRLRGYRQVAAQIFGIAQSLSGGGSAARPLKFLRKPP